MQDLEGGDTTELLYSSSESPPRMLWRGMLCGPSPGGFVLVNSHELKQLCRGRSPHILLQPLLTKPWQSPILLPFGFWRKKIIVRFSGPQNTRWVQIVKGAYTLRQESVQMGAGVLYPWGEPVLETQKDLSCPAGVHTGLRFWLLLTVSNSNFHPLLRGRIIPRTSVISPKPLFFSS